MSRRGENIRKRKDGRWEGRYYTQDPQTGQSSVHSVYAKTYGEVKERLSAAKQSAKFFVLQKIKRSDRKIKCAGQRLINLTAHFIFISRNVFRSGRTR